MLLFGWDIETWRRALEWAAADVSLSDLPDQRKWSRFAAVRQQWLERGGPMDGPVHQLI
jgi:hypothetical protein